MLRKALGSPPLEGDNLLLKNHISAYQSISRFDGIGREAGSSLANSELLCDLVLLVVLERVAKDIVAGMKLEEQCSLLLRQGVIEA